jgi:uncharacterized protein DUF1559
MTLDGILTNSATVMGGQTMNITITCVGCRQKLSAPASLAGRRVPCPKCKAPVDVPATAPVGQATPPIFTAQVVPENRPKAPQQAAAAPGKNLLPPGQASPWDDLLPAAPAPGPAGAEQVDLGLGEPLRPVVKRRSAGRSQQTLVPMIAIVVLLFLVAGGIGAFMMLSKGSIGSDLQYVPDDSDIVVSVDVGAVITSGTGQKIKSRFADAFNALTKQMQQDGGDAKPEDIGRITFGVSPQREKFAGIAHFNKVIDDQEFARLPNAAKRNVGGHEMFVVNGMGVCRLDNRSIAAGDQESMQKILERNGPAKLSDEVTAAIGAVDFSNSFAAAVATKRLTSGTGAVGANLSAMPFGPDAVRGVALQGAVGDDIRLKAAVLCKDAATADQMKKMADAGIAMSKANAGKMPPAAGKIFDTLDISNSGATIHASVTLDTDSILSAAEPIARMATLGAGGRPQITPTPPNVSAPTIPQPNFPTATFPPVNRNPARNRPAANSAAPNVRLPATNNLHQIALALLEYQAKEGHFPPPAIYDAQGKPLLSWRVAILPYLKREQLYKQFHLDEPWDSQNNKRLVMQMPPAYRSVFGKVVGFNKTAMLAPLGQSVAFFGPEGRTLKDFTDGTSNTILVVEAGPEKAVEWTRPDDLTIDEANPKTGLFGNRDGGFLAAFADGPVKFIPQSIDDNTLRGLFTINGGEKIPPDFDVKP